MSRTRQILTRPELPSLEEILKDVQSAPVDDVAFTFLRSASSSPSGGAGESPAGGTAVMRGNKPDTSSTSDLGATSESRDTSKSFESAAKRPRQDIHVTGAPVQSSRESSRQAGGHSRNGDIQDCYLKVLDFLEMNSYLRDSQDKLAQQCSDLQDLGQSVRDQIESLRTQLQS
ncbi:uncharacterized protein [Diadema antillarum]|uniref:uncharacterized protein n=1 Tax=Diadema antillarum TaxID=105358 RepID=UPI003A8BF0DC